MLELLFLLLPIAVAYGWYMGHRSAKKEQEDISNKISRDYVTGVNFLLSNQHEKAVDLFLDMLQKQQSENEIDSGSRFEAELTLANLFRSRGEIDRALRIHQALDRSPDYSFEQKLLAKQQLAKDFLTVGFYDRAENLYILLVDEPDFAEVALQQLAQIYQKTKEWKKAINVAEKRALIAPTPNNIELAHYYCEYALSLMGQQAQQAEQLLQLALKVSQSCARASLLLAKLAIKQQDYQTAVQYLENILQQNAAYISEALADIQFCYQQLQQLDNFELFLVRADQQLANSDVVLALIDLIEQKEGQARAQAQLYQYLLKMPSINLFYRFIQYQIDEAEAGKAKDSLILLHNMVTERMKQTFAYSCSHCGYHSHKLTWYCPSCRQWETIKPVQIIEN